MEPGEFDDLKESGMILFDRSIKDRHYWETLMSEDLILAMHISIIEKTYRMLACHVIGKTILYGSGSALSPDPFLVEVNLIGAGTSRGVGDLVISNSRIFSPSRALFQKYWEYCESFSAHAGTIWPDDLGSIFVNHKEKIYVASSIDDVKYVDKVAKDHPFGYRNATVCLILVDQGIRVGAALVEVHTNNTQIHSACWRIFRDDYSWIKEHAVRIIRIFTSKNGEINGRKWHYHGLLYKAIERISEAISKPPLSIIEGASFDYHPLALKFNFNIEVPRHVDGSFYYWKSFNLPAEYFTREVSSEKVIQQTKFILKAREHMCNWVLRGNSRLISKALERHKWALIRNQENTGHWRSLKKGDIAFFLDELNEINCYGVIKDTSYGSIKGYENYPLGIDFASVVLVQKGHGIPIDQKSKILKQTFGRGITPISEHMGEMFKGALDSKEKEGRMWVNPNPYLLHETNFEIVKGQIFVVQAWALKDTVYPAIKNILANNGYIAKFSGDREGQLIFDDIWVMMNESEAVLVDFTDKKPNVYLEYGMALVLGKPVIAICQNKEDIPSDTPNLKCIFYRESFGATELDVKLPAAVKDTITDIQRRLSHSRKW